MVNDHSIVREGTCCCHMGYSFRLTTRVLLYGPFHRQDITYHGICYTSREAIAQWVHPMKDRSDDPSHHERTLLPRSYVSHQEKKMLSADGASSLLPTPGVMLPPFGELAEFRVFCDGTKATVTLTYGYTTKRRQPRKIRAP